jgi:hypothetical protein
MEGTRVHHFWKFWLDINGPSSPSTSSVKLAALRKAWRLSSGRLASGTASLGLKTVSSIDNNTASISALQHPEF